MPRCLSSDQEAFSVRITVFFANASHHKIVLLPKFEVFQPPAPASLVRGFLGFVKFKDFANRSPGLYALCLKRQHRFPGSCGLRGRSPGFEVNTDTADGLGIETGEMNHSISHVAP